jgi:hypothetical protein
MEHPRLRLARWLKETGTNQKAAGVLFGCRQSFVSGLLRPSDAGGRFPGRAVANAIERATATWVRGIIRSEDWDAAEAHERPAKKRAA